MQPPQTFFDLTEIFLMGLDFLGWQGLIHDFAHPCFAFFRRRNFEIEHRV